MIASVLAAEFHPPSTKDFVFDCYFIAIGVTCLRYDIRL